ncbi:MAG: hypothetical protein JO007_01480 [Alphaproteobacteria bacterium]|nr:hypothetical protein [Alphaproteobacteria bacterium]
MATVLPFCPLPSWYVSYWYEPADSPHPANRLGKLAIRFALRVTAATRFLWTRWLMPTVPKSSTRLST